MSAMIEWMNELMMVQMPAEQKDIPSLLAPLENSSTNCLPELLLIWSSGSEVLRYRCVVNAPKHSVIAITTIYVAP